MGKFVKKLFKKNVQNNASQYEMIISVAMIGFMTVLAVIGTLADRKH